MILTAYSKQQLAKASRDAISDAMGQLPLDACPPQWLLDRQKYIQPDIMRELRDDHANGTVDHTALAKRIAAGIPSHVLDGWSYFGRALHCLLRGDTRNSVHLGYFAELRAVLAIVAAEGIGVFDGQHFVIDANGYSERLCSSANVPAWSGTHRILWPIYRWWYSQKTSLDLVASIVQPGGSTLDEWFSSPSKRNIYLHHSAEIWLKDLGIDLKRMSQDSKARNASSYGPSAIHNWQIPLGVEAIDTVKRLWELFRPQYALPFNEIDCLILHRVLRTVFNGQSKRIEGSRGWTRDFRIFVDDFLDEQADPYTVESSAIQWNQYLCDDAVESDSLLALSGRQSTADNSQYPLELLIRAALLLRIATGSCGLHFEECDIGWESLEFWLDGIGVRRGLWESGTFPEAPIELWTDIGEALDEIDDASQFPGPGKDSPYSTTSHIPARCLMRFEECERIGLWGLGIL